MIYTIISLLAIVTSSRTNRLLLQNSPVPPAPAPPVPPVAPLPAAPAPPAPPATPVQPPPPVAPAPPVAVPPPVAPVQPPPPGVGMPPVVPPATGYPGQMPLAPAPPPPGVGYPGQVPPATGYPGTMPGAPAAVPGAPGAAPGGIPPLPPPLPLTPPQPFMELNCVVPHGMIGSCAGKPNNVINPPMNFKANCAAYGSCYGSTLNFDINAPVGPPGWQNQFAFGMPGVDYRIEGVWASEPYALAYGTVNIRNHGGPGSNNVVLENMECSNIGSCNGLTINLWGASVNDMHCDMPSYCMGCVIVDHGTIPPQAKPCWGY